MLLVQNHLSLRLPMINDLSAVPSSVLFSNIEFLLVGFLFQNGSRFLKIIDDESLIDNMRGSN